MQLQGDLFLKNFQTVNITELYNDLRSRGISLSEVSKRANMPYQTVKNILKTRRSKNPDPANLKTIADTFDYELKYEDDEPHFYKKPPQGNGKNIDNITAEVNSIYSEPIRRHETLPPIPILELDAVAEEGVIFDKLDKAFRDKPENFVPRLHGFDDPTAYALIVQSDHLQPFINPETVLVASPQAECQSGDLVHAMYGEGQHALRIVTYYEEYVQLRAYNQAYKDIIISNDQLHWCHKIAMILMP